MSRADDQQDPLPGCCNPREIGEDVGERVDLVLSTGLDYFFSSTLDGHDTSYSPDGTAVNPREDFTYSDADAAVSQPKLEPTLMLGFNYHF